MAARRRLRAQILKRRHEAADSQLECAEGTDNACPMSSELPGNESVSSRSSWPGSAIGIRWFRACSA